MSRSSFSTLLLCCALLSGCGGGGGGGGGSPSQPVDTSAPNAVASAVLFKIGGTPATSTAGTPQVQDPVSAASAPVASVTSTAAKQINTAGSSTTLSVSFQPQASAVMAAIFAKIGGASSFFTFNAPPAGKAAGGVQNFTITLQLQEDFQTGQFCVELSGIDSGGLVSNVQTVCVVTAPANALQGTYGSPEGEDGTITFFSDGNYVLAVRNKDPNCGSVTTGAQMEVGTYTWNATTGAFTVGTPSLDNNGDCGFSGVATRTVTKNADGTLTLNVQDSHGSNSFVFIPVPSTLNTLIGSFQGAASGITRTPSAPILTFFDSNHYALVSLGTSPGAFPGLEVGCYSVDPSTDELTADASPTSQTCTTLSGQAPFDSNGEGGFSNPAPGTTRTVTVTGNNTVQFVGDSGPFTATRIPAPR